LVAKLPGRRMRRRGGAGRVKEGEREGGRKGRGGGEGRRRRMGGAGRGLALCANLELDFFSSISATLRHELTM